MHTTADEIGHELKPLLVDLDEALGYTTVKPESGRLSLLEAVYRQADIIGIPYPEGSYAWQSLQTGVNYADFCYAKLPLDVRVYIAVFTWLVVLIDDIAQADAEEWHQFMPRFFAGREHHNLVAQEFDRWLRLCYQYYSPATANFIVTSSLNFVNTCALEGSEMPKKTRTAGGQNWPYYIRERNSLSEGYAYMTFPKEVCPDVPYYLEAIPDIIGYLCAVNDVLSFYKEECVHDTDNYIHSKSSYEGVSVYETLRKLIQEAKDTHARVSLILEGRKPYAELWHQHAQGYMRMHKTSERYRLQDLGLGESLP